MQENNQNLYNLPYEEFYGDQYGYNTLWLNTQIGNNQPHGDQKLIAILPRKNIILLPNIRKALSEEYSKLPIEFEVLHNTSKDNKTVILISYIALNSERTSFKGGPWFSFDTRNGKIKVMDINNLVYGSHIGNNENGFISRYGRGNYDNYLFVPNKKEGNGISQNLYLLDLDNDKYTLLKQLSGDETFNCGDYQHSQFSLLFPHVVPTPRLIIYSQEFKDFSAIQSESFKCPISNNYFELNPAGY